MKSYGLVLLYLYTWRTVTTGPLLVGLVLLGLTIVAAAFLPLLGSSFGMPDMTVTFALKLFIIISLYAGLMQLLLSQHAVMGFSLAPFLIVFLLTLFDETIWRLYNNDSFIMMLSLATLGLWFHVLWILAHKRTWEPAFANSMAGYSQNNWIHDARLLQRFDAGAKASLAGSLLTIAIVLIATLFGRTGLLHYPLLIIACAFYDGYCSLCARAYEWSSLIEALVMLTSLGLLVGALIATFNNPELNLLFVIEIGMVLFAVLFRTVSKIRVERVDWQVLNAVQNKPAQAAS